MIEERQDAFELPSVSEREIDELWRTLRREIRRRGVDADTADDLCQETWLRTLRTPPASRDRERLGGWLHVVGRRLVCELRRSHRNRTAREREAARPERVMHDVLDEGDSRILRLAGELGEPYREVIRLRFLEDLSVEEIAAELGRSPATVRSQLARGLERLRMRLGAGRDARRPLFGWLGLRWLARRLAARRAWALAAGAAASLAALWLLWGPARVHGVDAASPALAALESAPNAGGRGAAPARAPLAPGSSTTRLPEPAGPTASGLRSIAGAVLAPDGSPVPGAQVWLGSRAGEGLPVARSDARGRYRVDGVDPRSFLWASAAPWCPSRRCYVASIASTGAEGRHDLCLATTRGRLKLLVLEPDGAPAAHVRVELDGQLGSGEISAVTADGALEIPDRRAVAGTTDELGRLELPMPDRTRAGLRVHRDGRLVLDGALALDDGDQSVEIVLPRAPLLAGIVLDPAGRPAARAALLVRQLDEAVLVPATADGVGRFAVEGLIPGEYTATALLADGSAAGRSDGVLADGELGSARIETSALGTIRGRALDGDRPVAGAQVSLCRVARPGLPADAALRTGEDGRFAFVCAEGVDYWLELQAPLEDLPCGFSEPLRTGERVELREEPERHARAALTLEFVEGDPARVPALVKLRCARPRITVEVAVDPLTRRATSLLPPGEYELDAWVPGAGFWRCKQRFSPTGAVQPLVMPRPGVVEIALELPPGTAGQVEAGIVLGGFNPFGFDSLGAHSSVREFAMDAEQRRLRAELFPGERPWFVRVPGFADETGRVRVEPGGLTRVALAPRRGVEVQLRLELPRPLATGEGLDLWVRTDSGERELGLPPQTLKQARAWELCTTLPLDAIALRARTPRGLEGGLELGPAALAPRAARAKLTLALEERR